MLWCWHWYFKGGWNVCMSHGGRGWHGWPVDRSFSKAAREVSWGVRFQSFVLFYQPSMVFVIKLVKMEKQKQNETVSGFALAASRFFFKASKHVFKNSLNNCAYVFNCDELSWFCDSGENLSRKYSSLPGGWLRWSKLLFLMSFCKTGQTFFFPFAKIIENCS